MYRAGWEGTMASYSTERYHQTVELISVVQACNHSTGELWKHHVDTYST